MRRTSLFLGVTMFAVLATSPGISAETRGSDNVDLRDEFASVIDGPFRVNPGGDFNGDGVMDLLVSRGDVAVSPTRGRTWVLFGPVRRSVRVDHLEEGEGFVVEGEKFRDWASQSAGAGDVNGDGLDDIAVGVPGASVTYVVFGKATDDPVALEDIGEGQLVPQGYRIEGAESWDVAGAGDVNMDGLADVLITSPFKGRFYLVHGQNSGFAIDLSEFDDGTQGAAGYRIDAPDAARNTDYAVANTGDVNGDGIPDAVVGVIRHDGADGDAYVVFGKLDPAPVDVRNLGPRGYQMSGPYRRSFAGWAVSAAGDPNGDGLADTLVTAPGLGNAYIVFGKADPATVELRYLGEGGIRIREAVNGTSLGDSAALIGDANGDGIEDLALGAPFAGMNDRPQSGSVYVVYGRSQPGTIQLGRPGYGFRIDGARGIHCGKFFNDCIGDLTGKSVAAAGDVNDDGRADVLLSAPYSRPGAPRERGKAYVVLGR